MDNKICNKCGNKKKIEDFPFRNRAKNIRHYNCKECWKEIRKLSYQKNKQVTLDRNTKNRLRNIEWLKDYKSKLKCNRCGEDHPAVLDFHHIDPNEKEFEVYRFVRYSISKIKAEIKKCEVLCSNCHRIHHYEEKMPL